MSRLNRRQFLRTSTGLAVAAAFGAPAVHAGGPKPPAVPRGTLGKTGLDVPAVGFGGHSWSYARVPTGGPRPRVVNLHEATGMIGLGLDMGVNYFDACTRPEEHEVPAKALKALGKTKDAIVCIRCLHLMQGTEADKKVLKDFIEERLKVWGRDHVDIMFAGMATYAYWDMSFAIEALEEMKKKGQARYIGFGSHFSPNQYRVAISKYGKHFDMCSLPYNLRHRVAEQVFEEAEKAKLGIVTIKPFARGSLFKALKEDEPKASDADLASKMMRFVAANKSVDVALCGVHSEDHVRQNFGAVSQPLAADEEAALTRQAQALARGGDWLEQHWV